MQTSPHQHNTHFVSHVNSSNSPRLMSAWWCSMSSPSPVTPHFRWECLPGPFAAFPLRASNACRPSVLWRARTALQQRGIAPEQIVWLQRVGTPANEIVKAARELDVDRIVIGSRGNALALKIRRI